MNHPFLDAFIETAELTNQRWKGQGLAPFIYDNVLAMPLYAENAVWPLGPEVDSWQTGARRDRLAELTGSKPGFTVKYGSPKPPGAEEDIAVPGPPHLPIPRLSNADTSVRAGGMEGAGVVGAGGGRRAISARSIPRRAVQQR